MGDYPVVCTLFILIFFSLNCSTSFDLLQQFQVPCPGNPVYNVQVTQTPASGKKGGTFGCTRKGDNDCSGGAHNQWHDGLDITAQPGSPLYAMYDGTVTNVRTSFRPGQYKADSFGNYISVRFTLPTGKQVNFKFNHLNAVIAKKNRKIKVGQIIALNGNTGNAAADDVIPHVHIQAFDTSDKPIDPKPYLTTKIDRDGNIVQPCY